VDGNARSSSSATTTARIAPGLLALRAFDLMLSAPTRSVHLGAEALAIAWRGARNMLGGEGGETNRVAGPPVL
jgi:hypothetical protein